MSNFFQRLTLSSLLSAILFVVVYFSNDPMLQPVFVVLTGAVIVAALWEYYRIAKGGGIEPVMSIGIIGSICYLYILYLTIDYSELSDWPLIVLGLILFSAFLSYFFSGMSPFTNIAVTVFGVVYLTVPLGMIIPIDLVYGRYWVLYLLLVTKLTDVGAYVVGKQWGKHKMAPVISPKKTWEGAVGGFLFGTFSSYVLHKLSVIVFGTALFNSSLQSLGFGAIMSIVAQIGDLSESLLKRDSGVKDSNRLPGLGGMLDIVDSLVFTTPLLYFFLKLFLDKRV